VIQWMNALLTFFKRALWHRELPNAIRMPVEPALLFFADASQETQPHDVHVPPKSSMHMPAGLFMLYPTQASPGHAIS